MKSEYTPRRRSEYGESAREVQLKQEVSLKLSTYSIHLHVHQEPHGIKVLVWESSSLPLKEHAHPWLLESPEATPTSVNKENHLPSDRRRKKTVRTFMKTDRPEEATAQTMAPRIATATIRSAQAGRNPRYQRHSTTSSHMDREKTKSRHEELSSST